MACQRFRRGYTMRITFIVGPAQCASCSTIFSFRIPWSGHEEHIQAMRCPCCRSEDVEIWVEWITPELEAVQ